jgi:ELWxxDGT repeat protein
MSSSIPLPSFCLALALCFLAGPAAGDPGPARMVADLVPGTEPVFQNLSGFVSVGKRTVFVRDLSLWVTDGTSQGTSALGVLCPPCGDVSLLGSTGSIAFYQVVQVHPNLDMRIWRTDGTPAGTFPVTGNLRLPKGFQGEPRFSSSLAGGRLFFMACTPELGCELWSSDGSTAGTAPVGEIEPGPESSDVRELAATGDQAFVIAGTPQGNLALWIADGPARRLKLVRETPQALLLSAAGPGRAFFIAQDAQGGGLEVWTSDGTAAGTQPLTHFAPEDPFGEFTSLFRSVDGRLYFTANDGVHGAELWSLDARPESLRRLSDFGDPGAVVSDLQKTGERIVFQVSQRSGRKIWSSRGDLKTTGPLTGCSGGCPFPKGTLADLGEGRFAFYGNNRRGDGFWVTDGTGAGTLLLQRPDRGHDLVQSVATGGRALFEINDEYDTGELWVTDGSPAGTFLAAHGGPRWSHYYGWAGALWAGSAGGRLVFPALPEGEIYDATLWSTGATAAASRPILPAQAGKSSQPRHLAPFRDGILLQDCAASDRGELRFVRGLETTRLLEIRSPCPAPVSAPVDLGAFALLLVYGENGDALWSTDGTPAGTVALVPAEGPDQPDEVVPFGGQAAFWLAVPVPVNQVQGQLWTTDGTPGGTRKLLDFPVGVDRNAFTGIGGRIYFFDQEQQGDHFSWRPWVSDGTPAGTGPLTPAVDPQAPEVPYSDLAFVGLGGRVYFPLAQKDGSIAIWSTDGTPAGAKPAVTAASGMMGPERLTAAGGRLYFAARRAGDPNGLLLPWVSDGTDAGTEPLAEIDLRTEPSVPEDEDQARARFVEVDGRVFFAASDPAHGEELWATDGTSEGTLLVRDITPGAFGSFPRSLEAWQGRLWFRARDAVHGMELWTSDGTAEGTRLVQDIAPGASWSTPAELTASDQGLYFSADDGVHGRELWVLPEKPE